MKSNNKNNILIKNIKLISKKFKAKNFEIADGYIIASKSSKKSILHFDLPNNYKIGIWFDTNQIFAEHTYMIDKFRPSYTEFSEKYNSLNDIALFIEKVAKIKNTECDTMLNNANKNTIELNRNIYQFIIKQENVLDIELKKNPNSYCYNYQYKLNVLLDTAIEDMEEKINLFENNLENIYKKYSEKISNNLSDENNIFYWILSNKIKNIQYFY